MATENEIRQAAVIINKAALECSEADADIMPGILMGVFAMLSEIACQLAIMNDKRGN